MKYKNLVLVLCLLAFFVTYFSRLAISPIIPLINDDLGTTNTQIGFALSGMWFAYGLSQFPSGLLGDLYGEKTIVLTAVGGTTLMTFLLALSTHYVLFFAVVVLLGAAAGLHYPVATSLLSRIHDQLGTVVGIHALGGPLAGLIAPVVTAWVGFRYGWQPAVAMSVIIGVFVVILFYFNVESTKPQKPNSSIRELLQGQALTTFLMNPVVLSSLVIAVAGIYVIQGLLSFLPTFLIEYQEYTPTQASVAFSLFFFIRAIGQVIVGRVSDVYTRNFSIGLSMLSGLFGIILLVIGQNNVLIMIGLVLTAIGASFITGLDPKFLDLIPESNVGTGFGLVRTIYAMLGAVGSVGVGLSADLFGWGFSFATLGALFGLSLLILSLEAIVNKL